MRDRSSPDAWQTGAMLRRAASMLVALALASVIGCGDDDTPPSLDAGVEAALDGGEALDSAVPDDAAADSGTPRPRRDAGLDPATFLDAAAFEYDYSCTGEVASSAAPLDRDPVVGDCSAGVWPDLDVLVEVCPTRSDITREDPTSGMTLPPADDRPLPTEIPVSESGSFRVGPDPDTWPETLRVVAWNVEYTRELDEQIEILATDPDFADADVYLLPEVDRCSTRNGVRRAARLLAERLQADYVYGIEFVELSIGRTIGGDTGQAIVSRRPLSGAALGCHVRISDWFASDGEPRLGQRVFLHADIPVGRTTARVYAVHFESNDVFGEGRVMQVKELLDAAQRLACDRPQIIGGDFNTWYATAPELVVMRNSGFVDATEAAGDTGVTHTGGSRLDYVWVRGFDVMGGIVRRDIERSDHYPIRVDLRLR